MNSRSANSWLVFLFCFVGVAIAHAGDVSLPLNGYYHPGRFMPVAFGTGQDLHLAADGAVTTLVQFPRGGVAPWLVISQPHVNSSPARLLHELAPTDRLIAFATEAPNIARDLFPNQSVVSVTLDPADPIPGPPQAWGTLDALVLDAATFNRFDDAKPDILLANGTSLAVRATGSDPPDLDRPWRLLHGFWICRAMPGTIAQTSDAAYAPVANFEPGRPARYRQQVFFLGLLFAMVMLAISLAPRPRAVNKQTLLAGVILLVSFAAVAGFIAWDREQPVLSEATGYVESVGPDRTLMDNWAFQRAIESTDARRSEAGGLETPIIPVHGGPENLTLVCGSDGLPTEFRYHLGADNAAAFVNRHQVWDSMIPTTLQPATSPLKSLVDAFYPGQKVLGQSPLATLPIYGGPLVWPDLVLASSDAMPRN